MTCVYRFDDRERSLLDTFRRCTEGRSGVRIQNERLAMGDIIIEADPIVGGPTVIVERKICTDLVASVFDGRLVEQHRRLIAYQSDAEASGNASVWIVVLVEGNLSEDTFARVGAAEGTADGRFRLCVGTQLRLALDSHPDQRRLFLRTSSEEETAALLLSLYRGVMRDPSERTIGTLRSVLRLPGRDRGSAFVRQLTATVGVSAALAARVAERFADVSKLVSAIKENPGETLAALCSALGGRIVSVRLLGDLGLAECIPEEAPRRKKRTRKLEAQSQPPETATVDP